MQSDCCRQAARAAPARGTIALVMRGASGVKVLWGEMRTQFFAGGGHCVGWVGSAAVVLGVAVTREV